MANKVAKKVTPKYSYGWKRQLPDFRDYRFALVHDAVNLPKQANLGQWMPAVKDQQTIGSCTANAITEALEFASIKAGETDVPLSRLQLYYDERKIEGTVKEDSGAEIRDGIKSAASTGVAPESLWPYDIAKFKVKPPRDVYVAAKKDVALVYQAVDQTAEAIKTAIVSGYPVVVGISVYESFESDDVAKTGVVPMPTANEQLLGGHAVIVFGFGDKPGYFTLRNSWGTSWGDNGNFYLPEAYLTNPNLASDFWVVSKVSG